MHTDPLQDPIWQAVTTVMGVTSLIIAIIALPGYEKWIGIFVAVCAAFLIIFIYARSKHTTKLKLIEFGSTEQASLKGVGGKQKAVPQFQQPNFSSPSPNPPSIRDNVATRKIYKSAGFYMKLTLILSILFLVITFVFDGIYYNPTHPVWVDTTSGILISLDFIFIILFISFLVTSIIKKIKKSIFLK